MKNFKIIFIIVFSILISSLCFSREKIEIQTPRGSEVYIAGTNINIKYMATERINAVNIYISLDNGMSYRKIASTKIFGKERLFNFKWTIPSNYRSSSYCYIKIEHAAKRSIYTTTVRPFSIISDQKLTLLKPNGGETYLRNTFVDIVWGRIETMKFADIYLTTDSGATWTAIARSVEDIGRFKWKIDEKTAVSSRCKIKIVNSANSRQGDISNGYFSIK